MKERKYKVSIGGKDNNRFLIYDKQSGELLGGVTRDGEQFSQKVYLRRDDLWVDILDLVEKGDRGEKR